MYSSEGPTREESGRAKERERERERDAIVVRAKRKKKQPNSTVAKRSRAEQERDHDQTLCSCPSFLFRSSVVGPWVRFFSRGQRRLPAISFSISLSLSLSRSLLLFALTACLSCFASCPPPHHHHQPALLWRFDPYPFILKFHLSCLSVPGSLANPHTRGAVFGPHKKDDPLAWTLCGKCALLLPLLPSSFLYPPAPNTCQVRWSTERGHGNAAPPPKPPPHPCVYIVPPPQKNNPFSPIYHTPLAPPFWEEPLLPPLTTNTITRCAPPPPTTSTLQ
jgi:hypothetical protein